LRFCRLTAAQSEAQIVCCRDALNVRRSRCRSLFGRFPALRREEQADATVFARNKLGTGFLELLDGSLSSSHRGHGPGSRQSGQPQCLGIALTARPAISKGGRLPPAARPTVEDVGACNE